jgi:DNA-directed RNA polymerase specialized sigma24 family protein
MMFGAGPLLVADTSEAQDVAQETFLKLWQHTKPIPPEAVKPWPLRATRNACLDRLKQAISELQELYRSLVVLRDVQQYS